MQLTQVGRKIFLDRYAKKDGSRKTLAVGDLVIACLNKDTGEREIGKVISLGSSEAHVQLETNMEILVSLDHIDKPLELDIGETFARVAKAVAQNENGTQEEWEHAFLGILSHGEFMPGGRILAGAGMRERLSLLNCFVLPNPQDSRGGIFTTLNNMAELMSRGGGVGINISTLRGKNAFVRGVNGRSSGAVSWAELYSYTTGLVEQAGSRRGALLLLLEDWHPDLLDFITAKTEEGKISNANISVGLSDAFMQAVREDKQWALMFPDTADPDYDTYWDGSITKWQAMGKRVVVHKTLPAREVWKAITQSAWSSGEPGLWFRDRANQQSNSYYYNEIIGMNPCGEVQLPGHGTCNLGSLVLPRFLHAVGGNVVVNWSGMCSTIKWAVRFLDNVLDISPHFFPEQGAQQKHERRIGLGTMGLGEMLIRLGLRYGSPEALAFVDKLYGFVAVQAYMASSDLAALKGNFPAFEANKFVQSGFMQTMPEEMREMVLKQGLRNVTLLSQAPTGTIAALMNTSTGIEPYFMLEYQHTNRVGTYIERASVYEEWLHGHPGESLPTHFATAMDLTPEEHVNMLAAIQRWTDSSVSKTVNTPENCTQTQVAELYELMYTLGCKGGTIYRDNSRTTQVLKKVEPQVCMLNAECTTCG